jgi:hypothetical protein
LSIRVVDKWGDQRPIRKVKKMPEANTKANQLHHLNKHALRHPNDAVALAIISPSNPLLAHLRTMTKARQERRKLINDIKERNKDVMPDHRVGVMSRLLS